MTIYGLFRSCGLVLASTVALPLASLSAQVPDTSRTLDSLVHLALTTQGDQRRLVVIELGLNGSTRGHVTVASVGVVERLVRIYGVVNDETVRESIVRLMGVQAERLEAARFLAEVAASTSTHPDDSRRSASKSLEVILAPNLQTTALGGLESLGAEGEAALRDLYARGAVVDERAKQYLRWIAQRGFTVPPRRG